MHMSVMSTVQVRIKLLMFALNVKKHIKAQHQSSTLAVIVLVLFKVSHII